jgi:Peptidase family M41/ATPase family associated with various cellular activities (AAA)
MINIDLQLIEKKKKLLEKIKVQLKKDFIGIDEIIDSLLDYISVWYLIPEILNKPVVVNLWGMTGVGKTDLIRKLVKYLEFQDRFTEIELSNIDSTSWEKSVASVLEKYNFNDEKPAIVLFDEIQRFNTVDAEGKPITQTKFMDFWELLSDGKLSRKSKDDLDYHIFNLLSRQDDFKKRRASGEKIEDDKLNMWEARDLQKMLSLEGDYKDLLNISQDDGLDMIYNAKKKKKIYEPVNYAKTLIIISGNLDEAFNMAMATSESDVDADIFNAFTKKITIVDVKNSLSRKFRPEQVARFGNIHLIYNSLSKSSFEKLIVKEFKRIVTDTKSKFGITLTIGKDMNNLVYRNGVFPVQGVRPVFSSVIDIVETNLSKYLYESIMKGYKSIDIAYNEAKMIITATLDGKHVIKTPYTGRVDQVRNNNEQNAIANISVHESGHAVAYMALFSVVPLQLKSKLANSYAGGFTFPHQIHETKESIVKKIMIFLAGGLAEDIIFGENLASVGRGNDWEKLTSLAIDYIRKYGFGEYYQANYAMEQYAYQMDKHITDKSVEDLIVGLTEKTKELLIEHKPLLVELSKELSLHGSLSPMQVQKIGNKHNITTKIAEEGFLIIDDYDSRI